MLNITTGSTLTILLKILVESVLVFYFVIYALVANQTLRIDQNFKTSFGPLIVIASLINVVGIIFLMFLVAIN